MWALLRVYLILQGSDADETLPVINPVLTSKADLERAITAQADYVRELGRAHEPTALIRKEVEKLLDLKKRRQVKMIMN